MRVNDVSICYIVYISGNAKLPFILSTLPHLSQEDVIRRQGGKAIDLWRNSELAETRSSFPRWLCKVVQPCNLSLRGAINREARLSSSLLFCPALGNARLGKGKEIFQGIFINVNTRFADIDYIWPFSSLKSVFLTDILTLCTLLSLERSNSRSPRSVKFLATNLWFHVRKLLYFIFYTSLYIKKIIEY